MTRQIKFILSSVIIISINITFGQNPIDYIVDKTIPLNYFSDRDSLDFSVIGEAIGESRIVMLGEVGHGDGRTFEVKSELVEYLNKHKGFDYIALEGGGFLDIAIFNDWIEIDTSIYQYGNYIQNAWFNIWSYAEETKKFSTMLYNKEIIPLGIENQTYYASNYLPLFLKSKLKNTVLSNEISWDRLMEINQYFYYNDSLEPSQQLIDEAKIEYDKILNYLSSNEFNKAHNLSNLQSEVEIYIESINNLFVFYKQYLLSTQGYEAENKGINLRDEQMANNMFLFLDKLPKDAKVIVWAANFHVSNQLREVVYNEEDPLLYQRLKLFGEYIKEREGNNVFTIAFNSAEGESGFYYVEEASEIKAPENSLEYQLSKKFNYAFIPFSSIRKNNESIKETEFHSTILGDSNKKGKWLKSFDGVIFIKENKRANMIKNE